MDWLLVFVPAAMALNYLPARQHPLLVFASSALGLIPLAGLMGRATEQLAARTSAGWGGFLNRDSGDFVFLSAGAPAVVP